MIQVVNTSEEREFLKHEELESRLEKAITDAVEIEREACLKIAEDELRHRYHDTGARLGLETVRDKIRARWPGPIPHSVE